MQAAIDDEGRVVGDQHHSAVISDHEVELARQLRDEGMSYRRIAAKFGTSVNWAWLVCTYRRRASTVAGVREV